MNKSFKNHRKQKGRSWFWKKAVFAMLSLFVMSSEGYGEGEWQYYAGGGFSSSMVRIREVYQGNSEIVAEFSDKGLRYYPIIGMTSDVSIGFRGGSVSGSTVGSGIGWKHSFLITQREYTNQEVGRVKTDSKADNNETTTNDYGTTLTISTFNYTPAFIYASKSSSDNYWYTGIGIGLSYSIVKGEYYVTDYSDERSDNCKNSSTVEGIKENCPKKTINKNQGGMSMKYYIYGYRNGFLGLSLGGINQETWRTRVMKPRMKDKQNIYTQKYT